MLKRARTTELDCEQLKGLKLIENKELDNFDFSKAIVEKPWGYEYLFCSNEKLAAWILHIQKDYQTSMHCHAKKDTILIVLSGKAQCTTLNDSYELSEGDGLIIEKKCFHSTKALSDGGIILMEIETPEKKTDLVRLKDKYGRELKGYELQKEMCFDLSKYERIFFNESDIEHNKKIGGMNVCIKEFRDSSSLRNYLKTHTGSISIMLAGALINIGTDKNYKTGDVLNMGSSEIEYMGIKEPTRILHITKNILDFD